jgi:ABC-2 type transport system permease protein
MRAAATAPGVFRLLVPKVRVKINRARSEEGQGVKVVVLGIAAAVFWTVLFAVIHRMLLYFRGTQGIGDLLAGKLLGMALLTFVMILLLSNVITALSTFFLSDDLQRLAAAPLDPVRFYGARLVETVMDSSWMVALLAVPLLAAYGMVYGGGVGYALLALVVLVPFLLIPAVLGSAVTLLLVNVFPARRTRDLLALVGLFAAAGVVALLRMVRPERLVRPEEFRSLVDFMAVLRTPTSPWLPSEWAADTLMTWLSGSFDAFPLLLLISTAGACVVMGAALHGRFYPAGFTRAQEGAERREGRKRSVLVERLMGWSSPRVRQLVSKEVRVFFRDTTQWSQLVLLAVLVVVYVYNIKVLPLYTGETISFFLINLVSFLNMGLAGFVVAAIAARFVFPAMSLEGRMTWLLQSSPLRARTLFWAKYAVGTVPLLLVAVPLILVTNIILQVSPFILALTTVTMIGATAALSAMALSFGALFPNFDTENVAEIPTSFGGLLFMMSAVVYLGAVVALEAWPVYRFMAARLAGAVGGQSPLPMVTGLGSAAAITVAVVWASLRVGVRRVGSMGGAGSSS